MDLLSHDMIKKMSLRLPVMEESDGGILSREARIAAFNKKASKTMDPKQAFKNTLDFTRKARDNISIPLSFLRSISLSDLKVSKTHSGCIVYCKIATRVMKFASIMVLVEDDSALVDLAVYGDIDENEFKEGRMIAIKEPFYKCRHDGTNGIRVDDPSDLIFDLVKDQGKMSTSFLPLPTKRCTVEERLQEILDSNEGKGIDKLYRQLADEGYSINKKQIRALKKTIASKSSGQKNTGNEKTNSSTTLVPIISERRPEKHRSLRIQKVLECKEAGNRAFMSKAFLEAEKLYSEALKNKKGPTDDSVGVVCLWQLYSNRSAVRIKLGMFTEALQDGLAANIYAPLDEVKPLIRCVEAMSSLGLHHEALKLLEDCHEQFPNDRVLIEKKMKSITPSKILVGKDSEITTITDAIKIAKAGAEIVVEPGIYRETLYITKPVTLRCDDVGEYDAIRSLQSSERFRGVELRPNDQTNAIFVMHANSGNAEKASHIIGFNIFVDAPQDLSIHAALICSGSAVFRNCKLTSSSGPVVAAQYPTSNVIMQACAIYEGAQGGILALDNAKLSLHQIHCYSNAASGLELRTGGSATLDSCQLYNNGKQGIISWKSAGIITAKNCNIHSHPFESGVLIEDSEAAFNSCYIYGNNLSGAVVQGKGILRMHDCEVHDNCEGILIQSTGSAYVEKCKIWSNSANGVFVGFDHRGSAVIVENDIHKNRCKGVLIGNSRNTVARGNREYENLGQIPLLPTNLNKKAALVTKKYLRRTAKNKAGIKKAMEEEIGGKTQSFLESLLFDIQEKTMESLKECYEKCAFCKASPPAGESFSKCTRCKEVSYCSRKCQRSHWSEHKKVCKDKTVKFPSFLDSTVSV